MHSQAKRLQLQLRKKAQVLMRALERGRQVLEREAVKELRGLMGGLTIQVSGGGRDV